MTRHIRIAPRGNTVRHQGVGPIGGLDAAFLGGYPPPGFSKAVGGPSDVFTSISSPPTGLYIPDYLGNPDVGLTSPGSLTTYTGPSDIPGGSYSDLEFIGGFDYYVGSDFTNCWFHGGNSYQILARSGNSTFTDCEFGKFGEDSNRLLYGTAGTYTLLRCNLHDSEDGAKIPDGSIVRMCHIHDLNTLNASAHSDGVQAEGDVTTALIEYNNIDCRPSDLTSGNAAVYIQPDLGTMDDITVHNNYINGGGYTMFVRTGAYPITNTVVTNNIFGPDFEYGHTSVDAGTYSVWADNVDTFGAPVDA